jgi:hypothetical protein
MIPTAGHYLARKLFLAICFPIVGYDLPGLLYGAFHHASPLEYPAQGMKGGRQISAFLKYPIAGRQAGQIPAAVRLERFVQRLPLFANVSPTAISLKGLRCMSFSPLSTRQPYHPPEPRQST